MSGLNISTAPTGSPSAAYSGPPPPYTYSASGPGSNPGLSGYISPPESTTRRSTREDEKSSPGRKSLPSIHEALGDKSLPFSAGSQHGPGSTPSTAVTQNFPEAPKGPSNPFSAPSFRETSFSTQPQTNPPAPPDLRSNPPFTSSTVAEPRPFPPPASPRTSAPSSFHANPLASSTFNARVEPQPPRSPPHIEQSRPPYSFPPIQKPPPSTYSNEPYQFAAASNLHEQRPPFPQGPDASYDHTIKRHIDVHEAAKDLSDVSTEFLGANASPNRFPDP